jgi:cell wall-associated NlpC family hydrolase
LKSRHVLAWTAGALALGVPAVIPPADAAAAAFGSRTLHVRSHGRDVRVLQASLTRLGVPTAVDGFFGRGTRRSVRAYERGNHLRVDGRVTPREARGIRTRVVAARRTEKAASPPVAAPEATTTDGTEAVLGADGRTALAPAGAPQAVVDAIAAANRITRKPYHYGGGHAAFQASGYDCSGAVSYALHGAGLLDAPRDSTGLESFGRAGKGTWITVYANAGHAFVVIAGLRFDTSGSGESGPRWRPEPRSGRGYVVRHPVGL